jgi:hypothetical protein
MIAALIVLLLLLVVLGYGGFAISNLLWFLLVIGLVLWLVGFFARSADGGGRWYRW